MINPASLCILVSEGNICVYERDEKVFRLCNLIYDCLDKKMNDQDYWTMEKITKEVPDHDIDATVKDAVDYLVNRRSLLKIKEMK